MKRNLIIVLLAVTALLQAQTPAAVHLGVNGRVENSVVFNNVELSAISAEPTVMFSATDNTLMPGDSNILLLLSPFVGTTWTINELSPLYNAGTTQVLGNSDTFDLNHNPRIRCGNADIGAYEFEGVPPVFVFSTEDIKVCEESIITLKVETDDENLTFQWYHNGEPLDGETSETLVFEAMIEDTGYYHAVIFCECDNAYHTDSVRVDVDQKLTEFYAMADTTIFRGDSIELFAFPEATQWSELLTGNVLTWLTVSPADTTVYVAAWHTEVCGIFYDTVQINVSVDTFRIQTFFLTGCENGEGSAWVETFGVTGPYTYSWTYQGTVISTDSIITNRQSGSYTIRVTDDNNSTMTSTVNIPQVSGITFSQPFLTHPDNRECSGGDIAVPVSGGTPIPGISYEYTWDNGTVGTNELRNVDAGSYTLTVRDFEGCTAVLTVDLQCLYRRVMATKFISPNGDGVNDYLRISNIEHYPNNRVIIVDARGNEINSFIRYDNDDPARRWGGQNQRGRLVPDGTYYYIVEAEEVGSMAGWVLVRDAR